MTWRVGEGDCVALMAAMPEASIDAIACDPPYGLEFMGKNWDGADGFRRTLNSADVGRDDPFGRASRTSPEYRAGSLFQSWCEIWAREALRVLKPGGHLLAFGGTRTFHRLACAVEDAGFEIRDCLSWLYGSGFPKSLDVSKAIDKRRDDEGDVRAVCRWLRASIDSSDHTVQSLAEHFGFHPRMVEHWAARDTDSQPTLPTLEQWDALRVLLGFDSEQDAEVLRLNLRKGEPGEAWADRPVTGEVEEWEHRTNYALTSRDGLRRDVALTDAALRWDGWGTALKPAWEPIVLARKPLAGTVAANVLEHGTGALNIAAARVGDGGGTRGASRGETPGVALQGSVDGSLNGKAGEAVPGLGRWPANVALDEDAAATLDVGYGSSGGASRFFYVAKASSAERNAGLDGFEERATGLMEDDGYEWKRDGRGVERERRTYSRNTHPTVKPVALMRWLVRLVTPPGGTVLDPFVGSGTTGCAAVLEGFDFIGCDREAEYVAIAQARIAWWAEHPEGMDLVERLEAEKLRTAVADSGQLDLLDGA